jgi:hypothetical protein
MALDAPPGARDLYLALRQPDTRLPLSSRSGWGIGRAAPVALPRSRVREHYLPFGGKLALVGATTEEEWRAGETQRVALRFLGLRPIVRDYVVSVGARGDRPVAHVSDSVPAIGAIPTFKWIRGSLVTDVHLILPQADAVGEVYLTLGVYDAFTSEALPPLDERIARLGLSYVPLGGISVR